MEIDGRLAERALGLVSELGLLSPCEATQVRALLGHEFPFAATVRLADSIHLHVKVDDVARLPHERFESAGSLGENAQDGYVKYPMAGRVNLIFSSIDISEEDRIPGFVHSSKPFLDHVGIDLRRESEDVRNAFQAVPEQALSLGWRHLSQGGDAGGVFCCHTEVKGKHWVYPGAAAAFTRPIEFAYGALVVHGGAMGCDLRPIDPAHPLAAQAGAGAGCCGAIVTPVALGVRRGSSEA
jgi:hypothetical protein